MRVNSQNMKLHMNCGLCVCVCEGGGWSSYIPTILSYVEVKVSIFEQKNLHVSMTRDQIQNFLNKSLFFFALGPAGPLL
jgi:hypothetical protein